MCFDILKNPVKSIAAAKKQNLNKTFTVILEECVLLAVAGGLIAAKLGFGSSGVFAAAVAMFLFAIIFVLLFSLMVHIAASMLGGKGKFYEGLTAVSYAMLPAAAGFFVVSLLAFIPFTLGVQIIVLALSLVSGFSMLYRGVRELYRTDLLTAFVAISVVIAVLIITLYITAGMTLLGSLPLRALA